jgi:DNA-directed RNA polymerase subunit RPC12/RpoP
MSLLNNAVMSVQLGLEDLEKGTGARNLSAVRNLHAGVVLLLKAKLLELSAPGSDEVLLKQKIKPRLAKSGRIEFVGTGRKTVELDEIKTRLTAIGVVVDWERIERLTRERNNVEHYYPQITDEALRGLAADVLVIIRDFATRELGREPIELFGEACWTQLLANKEVFDSERHDCLDALGTLRWPTDTARRASEDYACSQCAAQLFHPSGSSKDIEELEIQCRACGHTTNASSFVEAALREYLAGDRYEAVKDGGRDPLTDCPGCFRETFLVEEGICAMCGYELDFLSCMRCDSPLEADDQDLGGLCGYCQHVSDTDD